MSKFTEDLSRYRARGYRGKDLWLNPAVWAIASYRLSSWVYVDKPMALIRIPLKLFSFVLMKSCVVILEMDIDPQATIGGGLYIGHTGGVHINPGAVLGRNCDLAHGVTIGASAMGRQGVPVLGDDVYVGARATLAGKIKIGNGAKIAANTLVINNVPAGATVMGVPGRIVMRAKVPQSTSVGAGTETSHEAEVTDGEQRG
jgi:serine O-acetyltransferase